MEFNTIESIALLFISFALGILFCIVVAMPKFEAYDDCVSQTQSQDYCFNKFIERK